MKTAPEFETIYREQYPRVKRICLGYAGGSHARADDLTQEVFIRVWQNLSNFRGDSAVSTWIYRIAVNTCLLHLRKKGKEVPVDSLGDYPEPDADEAQTVSGKDPERIRHLYRCIDTLPPGNRSVILLALEGLPQEEIAAITGLSHGAVRTRVHRIKQQLLKEMQS